ncbi:MAG: hypothetical protein WCO26_11255 [Deltaproteobacteria bacterium]
MKKWILLFLAMVLLINVVSMGIGCKAKAPEKPKEEVKPAEALAPPAPAATPAPAPAAPEATKK